MVEKRENKNALIIVVVVLLITAAFLLKGGFKARNSAPETSGQPSTSAPFQTEQGAASPESELTPAELKKGQDFEAALKSKLPTIADFGAGWCSACKMMKPVLNEAAVKHHEHMNVVYVDTDEFPARAQEYKISAIPTQVYFDKTGKEVGRHTGYYPLTEMEAELKAKGLLE